MVVFIVKFVTQHLKGKHSINEKKIIDMKTYSKIVIAFGAILLIVCAAIGCSKIDGNADISTTVPQTKSKIPDSIVIGYSDSDTSEFHFYENKDSLMARIEAIVQDSISDDIIVEDVAVVIIDNVPVLKVSLYDTDQGISIVAAVEIQRNATKSTGYQYVYTRTTIRYSISCVSSGCGKTECRITRNGNRLACSPCKSGSCTQNESLSITIMRCVYQVMAA